jgi:hypothetical protein
MVAAAVATGRRLAPAIARFLAVSSSKLVQHEKSSSEVRATRTEPTWNFAWLFCTESPVLCCCMEFHWAAVLDMACIWS